MVNQVRATDAPLPYIIVNLPGQQGTVNQTWLHPDPRHCADLTHLSGWEREYLRLILQAIYKQLGSADRDIEDGPWND